MRRKEREIVSREEIEGVLRRAKIVRLAMCLDNVPHIVPMSYGYKDNALYLHSARVGRKMEILRANPVVAFEVEVGADIVPAARACDFTARYESVVGFGRVAFLESREEKIDALRILMEQYGKGPWEFEEKVLNATAALRIDIESMTGKRSPA